VNSSGQLIINDKHESLTEDVLKANKLNFHRVTHNTTTSIFEEDELFAALNTLMSPAKIASEEHLKSSLTATAFSTHETILFLIIFLLVVTIGSYLIFPNKIKRSIIGRSKSHLSDQP
jgi:glycosylphosphatidylinositol transamidase (GPIT) subunit GPI8